MGTAISLSIFLILQLSSDGYLTAYLLCIKVTDCHINTCQFFKCQA